MKCLNCGYCCIELDVIIINPKFIEEVTEENFYELTEEKYFSHKKFDKPCPYLKFINGKYSCSIHDKEWYKFTPCYEYDQISSSVKDPCRTGNQIEKETDLGIKLKKHLKEVFKKEIK